MKKEVRVGVSLGAVGGGKEGRNVDSCRSDKGRDVSRPRAQEIKNLIGRGRDVNHKRYDGKREGVVNQNGNNGRKKEFPEKKREKPLREAASSFL